MSTKAFRSKRRSMDVKKPELVAPSGDWSSLYSAVASGADAVYFGIKGMNMRDTASNFDILELSRLMDFLRSEGRKGYLALNVIVYENELKKVKRILEAALESGVDAVILWDMSVLSMARDLGLRIHLSTQASVSNFRALKTYCSLGVKRAVLARECTLSDIREMIRGIREEKIDCGIETFIHGAMCVSVSGRCFLSHHSFGKSSNRGQCIQPCRREFTISDADPVSEEGCEYVLGKDYILSTKDLCTIGFLDRMIESGIDAFKIEGRMRPPEYVRTVTSVYREAIDSFFEGKFTETLKEDLLGRLRQSFNRGFDDGFYFGAPDEPGEANQKGYEKVYLGEVVKFYKKIGVAEVLIRREALMPGQKILVTGNRTPASFAEVSEMQIEHKTVDFAGKGMSVGVKLPFAARPKDKVYLWQPVDF
ncbi:MAG: peptidase U32 family protein [Candidatus Omnitrophota bacterium]|nr:peptidase U32 family protein [Candidatus Omnitrophota bacterium]